MIAGLVSLAVAHGVRLACSEGYDLEPHELREALELVLRAKRDELRCIVQRLEDKPGNPCPPLFAGELRAARFALGVVERDLRAILPRKVFETSGVELPVRKAVG